MGRRVCSCAQVFDPLGPEKKAVGGPGNLCPSCSVGKETTERYVGSMIYDHKTAPSLEIRSGTTLVREAPRSETRRGGVPEAVPPRVAPTSPFTMSSPAPRTTPQPTREVNATWYDPVERKVYRVVNGEVYTAELPAQLIFVRRGALKRDQLATQKGRLAAALQVIQDFLAK